MKNSDSLVPAGADPKKLLSYQKADTIFQITYYFAVNYLAKGDRTVDQMIQAARSGKQNIVEGCAAAPTSTKTELHLLNVAKASLKEVLADYEDYPSIPEVLQDGKKGARSMKKCGNSEQRIMIPTSLWNWSGHVRRIQSPTWR